MLGNRYRGPPMTLGNMRANGVSSLSVRCELCRHEAVLNVDAFNDAVPVPSFGPRMVCTSCGIHWRRRAPELAGARADQKPDWPAVALMGQGSEALNGRAIEKLARPAFTSLANLHHSQARRVHRVGRCAGRKGRHRRGDRAIQH
jgi:hypothetical protein